MVRISKERMSIVESEVAAGGQDVEEPEPYVPKTPLGRRLMEIREQIVASGQPLLDWDELEREVAERRGGVADES